MPRGLYGLQRITTLANAVTDGLLSAALWSKLSALLGINSITLPLRLTGSALSVDPATSGAAGTMSAADKTKLDAATSGNTPGALVIRDGNGDIAVRYVNGALNGNASSASTATTANSATTATTANALAAGTADGDKLHGLVTTVETRTNGAGGTWYMHHFADGYRLLTTVLTIGLPAAVDAVLVTLSLPSDIGLDQGNVVIAVSHLCANGQQINTAMRGNAGTGFNASDNLFQIAARTIDGTNLNTKDGTLRLFVTVTVY